MGELEKLGPIENVTAEYVGVIKIEALEIPCAVLSNEKRVFFQREVLGVLTGNKKGGIERYFNAKNLESYVPEKFKGKSWDLNILKFEYKGNTAHGFEASDLIDICYMYINAYNDGVLHPSQKSLAKRANIIVKAFAKTGVVAVIDEATGYQYLRKKDAIRLLVESYIIEEARRWTKEFPDEFFEELDNLYGNDRTVSRNRPRYYGGFINRYIYEPIEGGNILEELNELNPVDIKGDRKKRFHQFLNEEKGIKILRNRIGKITALLQISPNKRVFERNYKRMESKQYAFDFEENQQDM
jgi:hypothetical protein